MKVPSVRFVFDRNGRADDYKTKNKKTKGLVQIELYYSGKRTYFSTGVKLFKGQWDDNRYVINSIDAGVINVQLTSIMTKMQEVIARQVKSNSFSVLDFEDAIKDSGTKEDSFLDAFNDFIDHIYDRGMSKKTYQLYRSALRKLEDYNDSSATIHKIRRFEDLTYQAICEFDEFIITSIERSSAVSYHAKIKCVIHECIKKKKTTIQNPYDLFRIERDKKEVIKYLNEKELMLLDKYQPKTKGAEFAKDLWMFMRYTGMSFTDAVSFDMERDAVEEDGKLVVKKNRNKTGKPYTIVLLKPAVDIVRKYGGKMNRSKMTNCNMLLRKIGKNSIGRAITTKMARHTYAVWALHNGVRIENVSKMLGHTNINTTQIYAKVLAKDVIDEFDKLDNAIGEKKK